MIPSDDGLGAVRPAARWIACGLLLWIFLAGYGCTRETTPAERRLELHACRLKGVEIAVRCGDLAVPEARGGSTAGTTPRSIDIHVAVIPALARKPEADAVFVLAGGPGQSATDVAGVVYPLFSKINRERDIVLVDQRGTGGSHPLSCTTETAAASPDDEADLASFERLTTRCAERLSASADLTRYDTSTAMQDLDDVRDALGYPSIDLWGASYGTRAALEYARQFPARVRTMTLDGVAPAWQKLPLSFGVDTYATLVALVDACTRDAACARSYPRLGADVDALLVRGAERQASVDALDPVTGRRRPLALTRLAVAQLVRTPLYLGITASLLPDALTRAAHGELDALAALGATVGDRMEEHLSLGMHLSVVCAEDVAAITPAERDAARAESVKSVVDGRPNPLALVYDEQYTTICRHWPTRPVAPDYFATLAGKPGSHVPTLLLSGGIDPATPPAHAAEVARALTNAKHLVAPSIGHGVSPQGCAPDLIERFIKSADPQSIDGACLATIPRPPFYVPLVETRDAPAKATLP